MQKMRIRTRTCAAIGAPICIGGAGVGWTARQINRAVEDCTAVARRHHADCEGRLQIDRVNAATEKRPQLCLYTSQPR